MSYIDDKGRTIYKGQEALDKFVQGVSARLQENRKLHYKTTFQDIPISIENRKGSIRRGEDADGDEWKTKMKTPYGYIPGTSSVDGEALDVFVGPNKDAAMAYIVHCNTPDGKEYDEDKVMLGFDSKDSAKRCYMQHYDDPKFFGGIDEIPMWKFREKIWVKKYTSKKLVASMRESQEGGPGSGPRDRKGSQKSLEKTHKVLVDHGWKYSHSSPKDFHHYYKTDSQGGKHLLIVSDHGQFSHQRPDIRRKDGANKLLARDASGHPATREYISTETLSGGKKKESQEGGPGSGPTHKEIVEHAGMRYMGSTEHPKGGNLIWFHDAQTGSSLAMRDKDMPDPQAVRDHVALSRQDFKRNKGELPAKKESEEHGVSGMKWGVRHARKDAGGQKRAPIEKRDLANDPKTMNMMQVVHRSQGALNAIAQGQRNKAEKLAQQNKKPPSVQEGHSEALNALKGLGWKILQVAAPLLHMEGAVGAITSVVNSPAGQKLFLRSDTQGNHTISSNDKKTVPVSRPHQKRTRTSVRESGTFEERLSGFARLREGKKIYYSRPMRRYGTASESKDIDAIEEAYPDSEIDYPQTKKHAELGMGYFHDKIDKVNRVVVRPDKKNRLTTGVYSEARHAIKNKIPVFVLRKGKLSRVKSVKVLSDPDKTGHFGKVILRKKKR